MTVDTAILRAQAMDDIDSMRDLTGRSDLGPREVIALCDALEAERERVRVLTRIGARIVESEVSRRPGLRSLAIEELRAALATAGGEGATT